jgi:hypothetical protein
MSIHSFAISIALSILSLASSGFISAKSGTNPGAKALTRHAKIVPTEKSCEFQQISPKPSALSFSHLKKIDDKK